MTNLEATQKGMTRLAKEIEDLRRMLTVMFDARFDEQDKCINIEREYWKEQCKMN
jgi:hypothetical protein